MLMLVVPGPPSECLTLHPAAKNEVSRQLSQAFLSISDQQFQAVKDRICLFKELIRLFENKLNKQQCVPILYAVLEGNTDLAKANVKEDDAIGEGSSILSEAKAFFVGKDDLFQRATDVAQSVSDSQFLAQLREDMKRFAEYGDKLKPLAEKAKERALARLEVDIMRMVKNPMPGLLRIHEEEWVKYESAKRREEEPDRLRVNLIKDVNELSTQTLCPWVSMLLLIV